MQNVQQLKNEMPKKEKQKRETTKKAMSKQKKTIFLLIMMLILCYLIYTIYLLIKQPTDIFVIEEGKLYQEETAIGYVIRDEKIIKGENYKNGIKQIKSEGERVGKNENVFRYYSSNEESLKKKIEELDQKIQEVMTKDESIFSADMKALENQIDEKVEQINKITDVTKLGEYKKEINQLVTKKAKIAGELSPKGSYLNQLISERREYESKLNSGAEYIVTPLSGIVSYKVDGFEEVLTPSNFEELNKEYLEKLDLKTGKIVASNDESGKIINNFKCYIATVVKSEEAKQAEVNDKIKIRLSNNVEVNAKITNIKNENEEETLIVLEIDKQVEELINYRKISFNLIWWSASGLKIPNQAIVEKEELNYVVRNRAGYLSEILVNVKKKGDKYSIVEPYKAEELKELGYSNDKINNYKKIMLYDEVLLNPDIGEME